MVNELFKHSSSELNLNLLFLVVKSLLIVFVTFLLDLTLPGPIFHSFPSSETEISSKFFSSSSALLASLVNCSFANAASA